MGLMNLPQSKIDKVPDVSVGDPVSVLGFEGKVVGIDPTHLSIEHDGGITILPFILFFC